MSKYDIKEDLSSLMDGERTKLSKEALVEQILNDEECCKTWQRFQLMRKAIKNDFQPSLVQRVRAEIDKISLEEKDKQ